MELLGQFFFYIYLLLADSISLEFPYLCATPFVAVFIYGDIFYITGLNPEEIYDKSLNMRLLGILYQYLRFLNLSSAHEFQFENVSCLQHGKITKCLINCLC